MQRSVVSGLEDRLAEVTAVASRQFETAEELETALRSLYQIINETDPAELDRAAVTQAAPQLLRTLFKARMRLRDRIPAWQVQGIFNRPAQGALRDVFRIARYAEDMLGEIAADNERLEKGQSTRRAFTGRSWNTLVHPAFDAGENIPFRSGDLLLMRGSAHNSAAIARIGDVDSQFSHIAIIYIDNAGKHWVVEALIEEGSILTTLESVLDHNVGRMVLYRHPNPALAAQAAKLAYERVLASKTGFASHIPYDFTMRLRGRRKLFCAKLVAQAYADATDGALQLPAFKTRFDHRNNKAFLQAVGVRAKESFAPGDIDLDTRFDLIAEWRDYRVTPVLRRQDMIMTKFFEWMETRGYRFEETPVIRLISIFGRLSSYLSNGAKNLLSRVFPKVPRNMSRSCVATIVMLHKSAEDVMPSLAALDEDHVRMTGFPLHAREMLDHLERLREVSSGHVGYLRGRA
ncbi:YiiX/YebB-like N1pC/P60 family cysteine hydrolase [Hyphomicrobium sp. CS1GBMeth3]|uniref:YiiX/YebB-like N1pC/P60 family cysteine hydrolase n=1 Tax=Hyphomicrobium sp. CS1GBMeth3 TaxID=1892845 RepID=UPI000B0D780E|nr:YiiX/YebB-like N1pC/P60 family cysteine hydrolase [Hyphomicrobium sp. CS1GBMeth3]